MSAEVERKPRRRILLLLTFLLTVAFILVGQLFRWQVLQHKYFVHMAEAEHRSSREIPPLRGTIKDRRGYTLAIDTFQYKISADPPLIERPHQTADRLAPLLNIPRDKILELLTQHVPHVRLALGVPQQIGEAIASWDIKGITVEPTLVRVYPEEQLAAHLLGFVNALQDGFYGVEGYYDQRLKGQKGLRQGQRGPLGEILPIGFREVIPPRPGSSLVLTVDRTVQAMVERELANALGRFGAESGTIIVMEPRTGSILAMASLPSYNPNVYYDQWSPEMFLNPAVSSQYEPGSVFKIVTMAAGLDAGIITPYSTFYDSGSIEVGGRTIENSDRLSHGEVSMTDVLALSLNVGSAHVSTTLGKEQFYAYLRGFGFGRITGVDLASEGPGRLRLPGDSDWHESDLGTNSFGQGIAVTPLQMVSAVAAVANRGVLMKPHVAKQIIDGQNVTVVRPTVVRRVIAPHTAEMLTEMLIEATQRGAPLATLPGYKVAGKTGTSQIPVPGGYDPNQTIASFVGYAPADDPRFVMLVKLDKPQTSPWGREVAAPVFASVARELINYLDIPPDNVRLAYR